MTESYQDLLAILILKNENFADAYQLCKVMSWKFGILNCSEIIGRIESKGYVLVTYPKSQTLKFFSLTSEGRKMIQEKVNSLIAVLKDEYPSEADFINKLSSYE